MAWIRGNNVFEIVRGASRNGTLIKLKRKIEQGWQQQSEVEPYGEGYACLVKKEIVRKTSSTCTN